MSCLSIAELPVSEQVEISLAHADRLIARTSHVLATFDSRATGSSPEVSAPCARGSILFRQEDPNVIERQHRQHPPLRVCNCIRAPRMFEARGDGVVRYYVECAPCAIRSPRLGSARAAANAWNARDLVHINVPEVV